MSSSLLTLSMEQTHPKAQAYFDHLQSASDCASLLKKFLTEDVFLQTKDLSTSSGASLVDIIKSGVENLDSSIGVYAADSDSYKTFSPLLDPILSFYHNLSPGFVHPQSNFGEPGSLSNLDPSGKYIVSTRIRCARSFQHYPFASMLNQEQYEEIEGTMINVFNSLSGDLAGEYYRIPSQPGAATDKFFFHRGDRFLESAKAFQHWPVGRGVFCNTAKTLFVWVNEEDHLRIISMENGADLSSVYSRWLRAIEEIGSKVEFAKDERLGYLTFCPTNIGTTIRASVHIKLPHLAMNQGLLREVAGKHDLQIRGTRGENSDVEDAVFDISNKRRCGLSEMEVMRCLEAGVREVIRAEEEEARSLTRL